LPATGRSVQIREAPPAPLPVPAWLPKLAEALAGQRVNAAGLLEPVRPAELWAVQQTMAGWVNLLGVPALAGPTPPRSGVNALPDPSPAEAGTQNDPDFYARWAKWFLADARTRTVLPSSPLTLPQYAQSLLEQGTPKAYREALLFCFS
jgi:hypothetical protein